MTNPHTPADPRPRDERDESAWDSMAREGRPLRWILAAFGLVIVGHLFDAPAIAFAIKDYFS